MRLATGSLVEQMNAHPFAKLHTALTHNGETTNYEALKQRVEQFNLSPLATTYTEVASLKFHLMADAWEYPDWALFESFSPTTGDDLQLVEPAIRAQLEHFSGLNSPAHPMAPINIFACGITRTQAPPNELGWWIKTKKHHN